MGVSTNLTNKPINPRGNDQSPKGYNRAALYSGKALDFDGVNDYVDLDGFTMAGTTATISFYYKTDSNKALAYIFDNTQRWVIGQADTTDSFGFYDGSTWRKSTQTLTLGEWYHITAVIDGGNVEFLWNGQSVGDTFTGANPISWASLTTFKLGWSYSASGIGQINGQLSGFKIFNTALTAAQVADLYNNPEKIVPTGVEDTALKLWLPMMEGAGTTAYDGSGNGNHGTISGATYVNGVGAPVAQSAVIDWNKGTNLALYSEQLDNAYYIKASILSVDANATTAPDGLTTAENIKPDTNSNQHYLYNLGIGLTGQHTISIFAKYNGYNIGLRPQGIGSGQAFANFDLQNGTILGSGGTYYDDSSITSLGDGWYRCSLTLTYATAYGFGIYVVNGTTATELPVFSGDGTSGVYAWGAQANAGATLTPYVRTGATAQPTPVLLPQGLTSGRDITGVNLFENVRKQGALNLDGNSWAEVHDNASLDMTTTATMEAWVNADGLDGGYDIIMVKSSSTFWTGSYGRYTLRANEARVNWWFDDFTTNAKYYDVVLSGWNHLAVTKDGTEEKLYINGALVSTQTGAATFTASPYSLVIGANSSKVEHWQSDIAQPRIYNRALTAEEVERNYNAGKNIYK